MTDSSDTLQKVTQLLVSQRVFGTPGASLTWGIGGAARGDVNAGMQGELATAKHLNPYAEDRDDITVFHSVKWPGNTDGDTDHIVISGNRVIIIDSKRWKGKRKYSVTARGQVLRGTVRFPEGKVKMLPALTAWRRTLPTGTRVSGIVCVAQKEVFVPYDQHWKAAPFKLVTLENLTEFLTRVLPTPTREEARYEPEIALPIMKRIIKPKPKPERIDFSR